MSVTIAISQKSNVKQKSSADLASNVGQPVMNKYEAESTAGQTTISLPYIVDTSSPDSFELFIDGRLMRIGTSSTHDFYFGAIDGNLGSSLIQLNSTLTAGLNIIAIKRGIKREVENLTDARFTQLYSGMDAGFQGFVDESSKLTAINGAPSAGQFRTFGIVGRASIPDLANDLRARMGVERIATQQVIELQNEFGPNGERVFKALNDDRDLIRFVGAWANQNAAYGQYVSSGTSTTDYIEIVFYGTGLNMILWNTGNDLRATVDGGSEGGNFQTATISSVLGNRNYSPGMPISVASGLSLGLHTIKIRNASGTFSANTFGFEILNEASTINVRPGTAYTQGKKLTSSSAQSLAYNSGTYDSIKRDGATVTSLSTRGNRTLTYIKSDGTISKSAIEVNSAQGNLGSADHTNEEVARTHSFREFGAGRSDDFSLNFSTSNRAFTLDDGTTTLVGNQMQATGSTPFTQEALLTNAINSFITFTFVGTGLDIEMGLKNASETVQILVNGTSIGTYTGTDFAAINRLQTKKIVSGLPYGTHTVKFLQTSNLDNIGFKKFTIYQPKKPTLPAGAVELADYNVMADFVANATATVNHIATGVLRKSSEREFVYVNGTGGTADWALSADPATRVSGTRALTDRLNAYFEYSFFGTGFEFRCVADTSRTSSMTVSLNGTVATAANFPTMATSVYGTGTAYNTGTGILDFNDASTTTGSGFRLSGLPLGKYTVRFNNNVASSYISLEAFDIITPIHSPKSNFQADLQNTLPVGSCAISDNRRLSPVKSEDPKKAWAQAVGVFSSPTTASTTEIPMPDMSVTITTKGGLVNISGVYSVEHSVGGGYVFSRIMIDGIVPLASQYAQFRAYAGTASGQLIHNQTIYLSAGTHKIDAVWYTPTGATATLTGLQRMLTVREL
jgi:hypothetical protein